MELKLVVGLSNEDGEQELVEIKSLVLLGVLDKLLAVEGYVFDGLSSVSTDKLHPTEYEEACKELGLMGGLITQAYNSGVTARANKLN